MFIVDIISKSLMLHYRSHRIRTQSIDDTALGAKKYASNTCDSITG